MVVVGKYSFRSKDIYMYKDMAGLRRPAFLLCAEAGNRIQDSIIPSVIVDISRKRNVYGSW